MTSFSSSSTSIDRKPEWICDVFLSFCHYDTGKSFVSHLYTALTQAGVLVFKADVVLQCGDEIKPTLTRAMQGSRISIIVFSENYANSTWLLSELEEIMECRRAIGQTVVPLFYGVDPSHVRHQGGTFGNAFKELERFVEKEKLMSWRATLTEAANISGYDLSYRDESATIENIVRDVTRILEKTYSLFVAYNPVGVESRLQDAIQLLNNEQPEHNLVTGDRNSRIRMHDLEKIYDVFLSFRGIDTRKQFISHLYTSLQNAGIHVFRDDGELKREDMSASLLQAIGQSRISIVVFSRNYAESRWCMLELENIMESRRTKGLVVMPVFYDVYSSDVRNQKGEFGNAFKNLLSNIPVDEYTERNWKTTLHEVGGIAGVDVINSCR